MINFKHYFYLPHWVQSKRRLPAVKSLAILALLIVFSAFGIVYTHDVHRCLLMRKQKLDEQYRRLQTDKGKRLLEYGLLTSEARLEGLAYKQRTMHIPRPSDIVIIPKEAR